MTRMIPLPHGGPGAAFDAADLVRHVQSSGRDYIIQGQINCKLDDHRKPSSLDVWLRKNYAATPDTKQAVNQVVKALVETGLFKVERNLICPDSGRPCKGLRLTDAGRTLAVSR